ncbi:MAG: PilZ domain-containing protein [Candidatus Koribacter versatilis]|uniref:PilZ domain-containing protein n=1 Tax=Candidatus Korobacter versatilis TaxID=658062 RepID=A0A932A9N4_9BACT|nr:PilZ domain-containing protein [Candidatus Koribacter versatilis]
MSGQEHKKKKAKKMEAKESEQGRERRRGPRWNMDFPVAYWDEEEHERQGKGADLSASGLGFFVEIPGAVGATTKVRFTLPASKETFELMGTIRSASGNRLGIQFSDMDDLQSAQLLAAIFGELTNRRPEVAGLTDPADVRAVEERLARIENAISLVSGEIKRAALEEEADALRALLKANQKALAKLDS